MKTNNTMKLIIAIVGSELAGIIGAFFTTPSIATWYAGLQKPTFSPANFVFGPVWTTLYALMGVALFLVWRKGAERKDVKTAIGIFIVQLFLNTLWSIIFFGLHSTGGAFIEIILLWLLILASIISFSRISLTASILLIPYIMWVSFAGFLNFSIWQLNKTNIASHSMPAWLQTTDPATKLTFNYPANFATNYIRTVDWPPKIQVLNEKYNCTEGGSEIARAGKTQKQIMNGTEYCVTKESEGAAGSIYTNYAYAFSRNNKTVILTFSLRFVQCGNYDDPKKAECERERSTFTPDGALDQIAKSIK